MSTPRTTKTRRPEVALPKTYAELVKAYNRFEYLRWYMEASQVMTMIREWRLTVEGLEYAAALAASRA